MAKPAVQFADDEAPAPEKKQRAPRREGPQIIAIDLPDSISKQCVDLSTRGALSLSELRTITRKAALEAAVAAVDGKIGQLAAAHLKAQAAALSGEISDPRD